MVSNPSKISISSFSQVVSEAEGLSSLKPVVAILDDDDVARKRMELIWNLSGGSFDFLQCKSPSEIWAALDSRRVHVLLLDRDLGKDPTGNLTNGIDLIPELLEAQAHLQILVLTGSDSVSEVVRAMSYGAANFQRVVERQEPAVLARTNSQV